MSCTAPKATMTARDQAHVIYDTIPPGLFRVENEEDRIAWRVSPEPFALSPKTVARIEGIGNDLLAFYRALNNLYNRSARGTAPAFIAEYLDRGKPEQIVKLARQNRFKQELPGVIRPDLLLTDDGFAASELDSVPGGMGFLGGMSQAYCKAGLESVGGADGIAESFAQMLVSSSGKEHPVVAVVVSEESGDYRPEMTWLSNAVRATGIAETYCVAPGDLVFTEEAMFVRLEGGREEKIDAIYRNFELFDLLNVHKQELMMYAARHNRVKMTPPPKAHLEEKLSFALFYNRALEPLWRSELGDEIFERLCAIFPRTWVLDPRPVPPQAFIEGLTANGQPVQRWDSLVDLGKGERDYVVKPSGFSELAWGSRGVKIANDLTKEEWKGALDTALQSFDKTPYILQRFHKGKRIRMPYLNRQTDDIAMFDGRVRLTPYYFVVDGAAKLGGIMATVAPADKRLIHGMVDAVMAPCMVKENGY